MSSVHPLVQMLTSYWVSRALYTAARLGVADAIHQLGQGGAVPVVQLAERVGAHPSALRRLLRALASVGVFREEGEPHSGRYGLTPLAEHLRADSPDSLRHAALMYGEEMAAAWQELPSALQDERPAWEKILGESHFGYYQTHPGPARIFDKAMGELGRAMYSDEALVSSYDFTAALGPDATVVDAGGGLGRFLACVLRAHPALRGVLYDLPHVIEAAECTHEGTPERARLSFEAGSFFERMPAGADAYVLKRVLHDWDDAACVALLTQVSRAMKPSGRVLVVEMLIPPGNEESFSKWIDLHMLVVTGGRERSEQEFSALFSRAGLSLVRVHRTPTLLCLIEAALLR